MAKVLVVVDMQTDFVNGALAAEGGPGIVEGVARRIRSFDGTVMYTLDTHYSNYFETQEGRNLPVSHCVKDSPGWELPAQVQAALNERGAKGFEKPSFGSPDLVLALVEQDKQAPIDEIILLGICTDICVLTNALALKCFLPEVKLTVESKLCAGVTCDRHNVALEAMGFCQINVV